MSRSKAPTVTVRGHPRTTDLHKVVNGILYVLRGALGLIVVGIAGSVALAEEALDGQRSAGS